MFPRISFAPDHSGAPHVGNLHTAVHAWALARSLGGEFVAPILPQQTLVALDWLGLAWDEGPDGDEEAPAWQPGGERAYGRFLTQLLSQGKAQELATEIVLHLPQGGQLVLRDGNGCFHPLFTAVVDEQVLAITHAVRSAAWSPDAPIALYLCQQLGWQPPQYVYLPLLQDAQGRPLPAPTQKGYHLHDLQAEGYLPQAVWHYLLLLGWTPASDPDQVDRWVVRQQYRLERLTSAPVTFSWDGLRQINQLYLQRLPDEEVMEGIRPFLEDAYELLPTDSKWLLALTRAIRPGLAVYADAVTQAAWAFDGGMELTPEGAAVLAQPAAHAILTRLVAELAAIVLLDEPTAHVILNALRRAFPPPADVETAVAAALTGHIAGPPLPAVLALLGKQRAMQRLADALKRPSRKP